MNKACYVRRVVGLFCCIFLLSASTLFPGVPTKKKILIAWSDGGSAHDSMRKALEEHFKDSYIIKSFNPLREVLFSLDPVRTVTFRYFDGEKLYNYLLARDMPWVINKFVGFGITAMRRQHAALVSLLDSYYKQENPDLIISVIPTLNSALAESADNYSLPFLLIAPDLDISKIYFPCKKKSNRFFCTLPFDDEIGWRGLKELGFDKTCVKLTGLPLRKTVFVDQEPVSLKQRFAIPDNKPIIMIMMGGAGSSRSLAFVRRFAKMDLSAHILVCIGRNTRIRRPLERLKLMPSMSLSVIGFTPDIPGLMKVADMLITKPGPLSLAEALEMRVPLLLDQTAIVFDWERPHIDFVKNNNLGLVLTRFADLEKMTRMLLFDKPFRQEIKKNMCRFSNRCFFEKLRTLLDDILNDRVT